MRVKLQMIKAVIYAANRQTKEARAVYDSVMASPYADHPILISDKMAYLEKTGQWDAAAELVPEFADLNEEMDLEDYTMENLCGLAESYRIYERAGRKAEATKMAQATRLFHALASQGMAPAEIATHMNAELSGEDNEQGMFVTMFICRLNLKFSLFEYCNAGHNPPAIGNEDGQFSFLEVKPNAPIGLWPGLEYEGESIDFFKDRLLFLYTDGLNEAEDSAQNQFGDDRLLEILRQTHFHTAKQVIETMTQEVERHRNGAEANDDLTMLCLRIS